MWQGSRRQDRQGPALLKRTASSRHWVCNGLHTLCTSDRYQRGRRHTCRPARSCRPAGWACPSGWERPSSSCGAQTESSAHLGLPGPFARCKPSALKPSLTAPPPDCCVQPCALRRRAHHAGHLLTACCLRAWCSGWSSRMVSPGKHLQVLSCWARQHWLLPRCLHLQPPCEQVPGAAPLSPRPTHGCRSQDWHTGRAPGALRRPACRLADWAPQAVSLRAQLQCRPWQQRMKLQRACDCVAVSEPSLCSLPACHHQCVLSCMSVKHCGLDCDRTRDQLQSLLALCHACRLRRAIARASNTEMPRESVCQHATVLCAG